VDKPLKSVTHGQCDARPTVTFPVAGHRRSATGTKLYGLVTQAHVCQQLANGRYLTAERPAVELATSRVASQRLDHYNTRPHAPLIARTFIKFITSEQFTPRSEIQSRSVELIHVTNHAQVDRPELMRRW